MNIHEYQSRDLLEKFGVPVPPGIVVDSAAGAGEAFEELASKHGTTLAVVKAQVHAGGRGRVAASSSLGPPKKHARTPTRSSLSP